MLKNILKVTYCLLDLFKNILSQAKDAERMNLENDLFMLQKQKMMQIELAEAASEFKNIPESNMPPSIQKINLG